MKGVISLTDWDWFQFLATQGDLDEVNFWRPSDTSRPNLEPGTPFIFKLNQKHGGWIVGYGIFATHSVKPMWIAWETLERKNGAGSFAELHAMLAAIRRGKDIESDPAGNFAIGCVMLSAPVFLARENWIQPPADWPRTGVMQGKSYDLSVGEGARVWQECVGATPATATPLPRAGEPASPRYGEPVLVTPRLGQGAFRFAVTDAYGGSCAVTTEHSLPVLEAAHIRPFAKDGPHLVTNGLLLRTDVHRLLDKGYVTVNPEDRRFVVSRHLRDDFGNGKSYDEYHGRKIIEPADARVRPAGEFLEWHAREVFRG